MPTISLAMIVYNTDKTLSYSLRMVECFVDEIIIVDLGSTDDTKEIARKYTSNVYDYSWDYNYADVRNFAYSKATSDYVFWFDTNEVIEKAERDKALAVKNALTPDIDAVYFGYFPRITKRENNYLWIEPVHEYLLVWGKKIYADISILSFEQKKPEMFQDITIYKKMIENYESFSEIGWYFYEALKRLESRNSPP